LWAWTILAVPAPWGERAKYSARQLIALARVWGCDHGITFPPGSFGFRGRKATFQTLKLPNWIFFRDSSLSGPLLTNDRELYPFGIRSAHPRSPRPGPEANHPTGPNLACLRRFPTRTDPCHLVALPEEHVRGTKTQRLLVEVSPSPPVVCLDSHPPCVSDTSRHRHARGRNR
jgi:hypothetical protein